MIQYPFELSTRTYPVNFTSVIDRFVERYEIAMLIYKIRLAYIVSQHQR